MIEPQPKQLLKKADERIRAAEVLYESKYYNDAVSRAYYAMLDVARIALLIDEIYPKSHSGTAHKFNEHFIKTGKIPQELGQILSRAEKSREEADYEFEKRFGEDDTLTILNQAKRFVKAVEDYITKS